MGLRPNLFSTNKTAGVPVTDPHGKAPRNWLISVMKVTFWLLDYVAGYWRKVWPVRFRNHLVIFDRYYHDLLIDPLRYRYGGPMWLARWIGKLIPKPDLWILLDAPAEVLQARKQEVPLDESARQRNAYLKLVKGMKNGVVIDAAQSLEKVVVDVNAAVLDFVATRTRKRLG